MGDINELVQKKLADTGKFSQEDLAEFSTEAPVDERAEANLTSTTETELKKTGDGLVTSAAGSNNVVGKVNKVTVSAEEKAAFLEALVQNKRFHKDYTTAAGRMNLRLRSRTVEETSAIISAFTAEIRAGKLVSTLEQTSRLRSMLMTFQVETLNGVDYASPEHPLVTTVSDAGTAQPAWLERASAWSAYNEAAHSMIWNCLADFEDRYWTMTESAKDSDFWQPAASI